MERSGSRHGITGRRTIRRAEVAEDGTSLTVANELAVRRALEAAGVEFIDKNGGGAGVRLRKPGKEKSSK
jgi:tRNA U34 5-methylaminomethyl-2-thiouridine-forming methyltransferase MnmC